MDQYEIIKNIGSGACGAVFLVRCLKTDREFALKKVQLDEQKRTRTRDALLKEVRILSNMKHPHIVGYHDSFFASDSNVNFIHIVQDYCDGGTLDERIAEKRKEGGYFEESLIMQIAMAVQYIHSRKILHRDLKPQNVFMTKAEGVKLGDFGIAKALDHTLDAAVTCVGTPCFLSPELCQDIPYSSKADIWALGCVLSEICALRPAFDAQNLISLFYKITNAQHTSIPDHFSEGLKSLIAILLVKEPELRPSASAILNQPFVRTYLDTFIQDREYLLKQKIISLKAAKSSACSSPTVKSRSTHAKTSGSNALRNSTPALNNRLTPQNLPPAWQSMDFSGTQTIGRGAASLAPPDKSAEAAGVSPQYSDDFDDSSSSEEEIVEDLQDIYDKRQEDRSADNKCDEVDDEPDPAAVVYDDDFEEDSEAEELDDIITNAREARSVSPTNDFFFDDQESPTKSIKQQLLGIAGGANPAADANVLHSRMKLKHTCNGDLMETCYLLEEDTN